MLKRSIGVGAIVLGVIAGITPARNLWTISAAWESLEKALPSEVKAAQIPPIADAFQEYRDIWNENLVALIGWSLVVILGVLIVVGPELRFLNRQRSIDSGN